MPLTAFYGNTKGAAVYAIDADAMDVLAIIPTAFGPYPVDRAGENSPLLVASTRLEKKVTIIDKDAFTRVRDIELTHEPRSAQSNGGGLVLISGKDRPQTSVLRLDSMEVVQIVGVDAPGEVRDFGGGLASGHERWVPGTERFFLIDRFNRTIALYALGSLKPLWVLNTPTSVHHIVPDPVRGDYWFAMAEGNPAAKTPPSVLVLRLLPNDTVETVAQRFLSVPAADLPQMGSHHLDFHRYNPEVLYIGSSEGRTYVLRRDTLEDVAAIETGVGAGHTGFAQFESRTVAVSVNHNAQHISVVDADAHRLLGHVQLTATPYNGRERLQGHTTYVRGNLFYVMAAADATFHEVDLAALRITRSKTLPHDPITNAKPFPMQGTFIASPAPVPASNEAGERVRTAWTVGHVCTDCC